MYSTSDAPVVSSLSELAPLVENLLLLLSEKEKAVVNKRFNLNGKGRFTLEQIGREFSVTRERIRQIEKNALMKMKRNVFNTSLHEIHSYVLQLLSKHGGLYRKSALIDELLTLVPADKTDSINRESLDLSLVLHEDIECVGNTINFHPHVKESKLAEFTLKHASNQLINQLQKYGDAENVNRVHADLSTVFSEIDFDLTKMRSLIDIDKRLTLLGNDAVALMEWRHIHPRTLRDKILFVLRNERKPLHFVEIAKSIDAANFDNRSVNLQAVHNELIRHDNFVLIGRGIYALSEWGYERGTVAQVIHKILEEKDELSQDEIVDLVLKQRHVKKITIVLALKNNKKFVRVGRKRYRLKA
ncbi:MAG: sigma factor-like helix-turn-helix DNA-binding protein [bacterium]|nr:sigma factor-like helix-turn-helix DNA-binding protein [bacterium]